MSRERIILVGHGSPKKDANQMDLVGRMLHESLHPGCTEGCVLTAYLQFQQPDLETRLADAVASGAESVVIHPYFLAAGMHVTSDIPGIIDRFRAENPSVRFTYTEPLGISAKLVSVVVDRIREAGGLAPRAIEERSFESLSEETALASYAPELHPIIKRVIHTTADFTFAQTMVFHPEALEAGLRSIKAGKGILVDVEMVRAGISKRLLDRFGCKVVCGLGDTAEPGHNTTRSEAAIEKHLTNEIGIVAIGNAPTALNKCIDLVSEGKARPDLVIGVPVGFVRAVESKARLAAQPWPHITIAGRKGGSTVAVAIVNALLKIAAGE